MVEDDLLNFTLEGEGDEEEGNPILKGARAYSSSLDSSKPAAAAFGRGTLNGSFPVSFTLLFVSVMCVKIGEKKKFDRVWP